MGFWALFEFALKCLYVVAWPCLALGYPLCASIRAIEAKSDYHTRKLVTYWILFYLISLFEHAFLKLLQRLPVWPYTKLAVVCWLVTRYFNGAVCVYKLVVRPCLSVDRETVINCFSRQKNSLRKGATVLAVVGKYIRDNGTEALVKLASKLTRANAKPCCIVDGSKSAAAKAEKASKPCVGAAENKAAAEDGDGVDASIAKRILAPVEVKRTTGSAGSSWEHPQIPAFFGEIPTCQVTKELDTTLNPLLLGREHQPADEEVKEKSQASKSELRHASTPKSTSILKAKKDKGSSLSVCSDKVDNHKANNSKPPKESVSDIGDSFNNITGEEEKLQVTQVVPYDNLSNNWVVELKQSKWWCKICNISCTSQGNMDCHLSGTKHLCKVQKTLAPVEIKETTGATGSCWEDPQIPAFFRKSPTNHMTTEPDTSMASHFQVMEHQAADEELKAKSEASKSELLHASTSKNSNVPKAENEKGSYVSVCSDKVDGDDANNSDPPKEELKKAELRKDEQSKSASGNGDSFNTIAKGEKLQFTQVIPHDNLNNNQCVEFKQSSDSSYTLTSIRLKASKPCVGMEESKAAAEDGDGVNASIAKRILVPVEVKQSTGSAGSSWEHPQIPAFFGEIPTCQVAKELDTTLNPLLLGREHQPADEELKEKSQASKSELRHASMPKSTSIPKAKKDKGSSLSVCSDKVDNHKANNSEPPKESVSDIGDSFNNITGEEEKLQVTQVVPYDNLSNNWVVQLKQSKWWCKICNISCSSQGNMDGHLKGSKHLCRAQKIIAVCGPSNWRCMICDISCTSAVDMDCHLKGKKHLARAEEVDSPDILKTQTVVEFKESKWWCLICNMSCGCQGAMDCHLKGRKHLSCARSMVVVFDTPEWRCTICNISTKNGVYMDCHLKGKKHLSSARLI